MAARYLLLLVVFSIKNSFIVHSLEVNLTRTTPNEIEGETTSFTCTVDELKHGKLHWHLNSKVLVTSPCSGSEVNTQLCLDITLYRNDSGSSLSCTSTGEFKNVNKTLQLNVLHPPDNVTLEANLTSDLIYTFNCTASGANPAVTITWLINITDVQSREVTVLLHNTAPFMWTTSSCITLRTNTITDVEGVICMTSFLNNDSYIVRELQGISLVTEISTMQPGPVERASTTRPDEGTSTDNSMYVTVYAIVTVSATVCLCVAIAIVWRFALKPKPRQPPAVDEDNEFSSWGSLTMGDSSFQPPEADHSFPREKIELLEVLGCGNFGQVYKALAMDILEVGTVTPVAVKILKKSSTSNLEEDFKKEIAVHETLTKHPNVVSMLGSCTETDPFYLILEFLPGGNLQDYLREKKLSWKESKEEDLDVELSPFQLLTFASQVANGMDYLSFVGCIHRDLASRNILLTGDLVCKLSDFGLARDVSATEQYEMTSMGLVPVRWLAMECLVDNTYTTMSDVWSFGVLLWEIVTLGAHPYRGMSSHDIIESLVEGFRLPQPVHCSKQVFLIMKECWREVPHTRPTFLSLKRTLDLMIADAPMYMDMSNFESDVYI